MAKKRIKKSVVVKSKTHSSSSSSLIDIIIPVRGRFDILEKCLAAIPDAFPDIGHNIIIVDNASHEVVGGTEVSKKFYSGMEVLYPNLLVVHNSGNPGFPASCNQGVRRKSSPIIFFLNDDVVLDPGSGLELLKSLDDPNVGVVGMKLRFADGSEYLDAGLNPEIRPAGKLQHIGLSVNVNGDIYHTYLGWSADHWRVDKQRVVFAVTGAAMMIRRNLFTKVGGFFEGYGLGTYEDVDLCMAVREQQLDVVVNPKASGIHYTGATLEQLQAGYPLTQNNSIFRSRWMHKIVWWDYFQL